METSKHTCRLFANNSVECKEDGDEKLERFYFTFKNLIAGLSENEAHDTLNGAVCKDAQTHEEISLGLLVGILSEPQAAARYYRDLTFISRDGLVLSFTRLNQIILNRYTKLQDSARAQIIWLLKEMIKNNVAGVDACCQNILRQIAGGDVSQKNVWLAESMLDIFVENRNWLDKFSFLSATVVYTYLRLIVDHGSPALASLRQREVDLTISLIREKFSECMIIGRDLVRLLQNVARIPEFDKLWKDIMHNPSSLCSGFTGLHYLMSRRTSRRFLLSRLTPDMEKKVCFLASQVRFGQHKRYEDWFQKQYLSTPESQSLRCDLIRFIINVIHPTNELLCSDIIPRWAVIGWLLTTCTSNVAASNAKLSLFYDWLFYDPEVDNIMNIEPAILVMHHSMRTHPAITATLLDFLCRIIPNFCPTLVEKVQQGIYISLKQILEKRVLPLVSLSPLFDSTKLDKELRLMIRDTFSDFCSNIEVVKMEDSATPQRDVVDISDDAQHSEAILMKDGPEFSDDEDDIPLAKVRLREMKFKPIKEIPKNELVDISEYVEQLVDDVKKYILQLQGENDNESRCEIMEKLVQAVIQEEEFDQETASVVATCLCALLRNQLEQKVFPEETDDESIEDSIGTPLFVMFRNLCQMPEEDPERQPILMLLAEIYNRQPKLGYQLLYFHKVSKVNDNKMSTYRDFCKTLDGKGLEPCLLHDLKLCQEDDIRLFYYLIPDIYSTFPNIAIGSPELLNLIVACIDSRQLQELICVILQKNLVMFRKDSFLSILNASLEWETFEQYCLWQLIAAHNIPVDYVLPILPKLEFIAHAEALTSILLLLKQEKPTTELVKHIMCREVKQQDFFVVSVLKYWSQEHEEKLAELIASQLNKSNVSPNKRKRQQGNKTQAPNIEQTLAHLDQLRHNCKQTSFFSQEIVQQALQQIQLTSSEATKTKYSDLFTLAEDVEESRTVHKNLRTTAGRKSNKSVRNKQPACSDLSEESSEEDEIVKPKPTKKRKRAAQMDSDSD
uniref:SOSS complex subunit A homolog n=1 Tax=Strigamia maritima TaxID=126957 RepID=T1JE28_STRMM